MRRQLFICLFLAGITLAVFWPVSRYDFINYDDPEYVTENVHIQQGLTLANVGWAFRAVVNANWHPITFLSHMLDCQLFGLNAGAHHLVNLLFHVANTLLLFHVLRQMTRDPWPSAMVAALFALHPLHVESVAWVSERKDVLSTFFGLLTIGAYARYVEKSKVQSPKSKVFYGLALVFFALGLMSKPMLVTWPFVLLLLDYWPLGRVAGGGWRGASDKNPVWWEYVRCWRPLLIEKLPFFVLAIAFSVVTYLVQHEAGALSSTGNLTMADRIDNSLISYVGYLGKTFWPDQLAVFYPRSLAWPVWQIPVSTALLVLISLLATWQARCRPFLLFGWLWFVGTLVPVIQLVQTGSHAMADRYTYVPLIGLFVMMAWGVKDIASRWQRAQPGMIVVAVAVVAACIPVTRLQLRHWRNSEALFRHTLDATPPNVIPHLKLGEALIEKGEFDQGIKEFNEALRIETLIDREMIDQGAGRTDEMVQINSNLAYLRCKLAQALVAQGKNAEAEAEYSTALQLKPYDVDIREALVLVIQKAATDRASAHLSEALKMQSPPDTGPSAAVVSARRGKIREAIAEYLTVLQGNPNLPIALNNLAWILATSEDPEIRNGAEAIQYAGRACELTHYQTTIYVGTLAAACAEAGRFDDAISMAEKACTLASAAGGQGLLLRRNQELLELYRAHQPYHEMTKP